MIYLDNNATTPVLDEVIDAMTPYYGQIYGNPHSAHRLGARAHEGIETARKQTAALLGASADEILFTSCGSESNGLALRGLLERDQVRKRVVTTTVEHPSVLALFNWMQQRGSIELRLAGVDKTGAIDLEMLEKMTSAGTALVSVMLAQNETGVIHDVESAAAIAHRAGALLHVDAVQAAAKIPIDVETMGADLLSISGHKLHAPKGIGALFVRKGITIDPLWQGGGQENGLRSGVEAVPLVVGLGRAAELGSAGIAAHDAIAGRRDRLESLLLQSLPDISINGSQPRLPNTSSISFHNLASDEVVRELDRAGICVSAGAACHSGAVEPSAVMKAMGKPRHEAIGTVRFSLSRLTTDEEITEAARLVSETIMRMRESVPSLASGRRS